jgi:hypothetical protein
MVEKDVEHAATILAILTTAGFSLAPAKSPRADRHADRRQHNNRRCDTGYFSALQGDPQSGPPQLRMGAGGSPPAGAAGPVALHNHDHRQLGPARDAV